MKVTEVSVHEESDIETVDELTEHCKTLKTCKTQVILINYFVLAHSATNKTEVLLVGQVEANEGNTLIRLHCLFSSSTCPHHACFFLFPLPQPSSGVQLGSSWHLPSCCRCGL
jgi:hypothetical protein